MKNRQSKEKGSLFQGRTRAVAIAILAVVLLGVFAIGGSRMFWKQEKTVGKQVTQERIQQFYWTYSTSTNPPVFQRYRISVEDGIPYFYHETREGNHWPLTEADVTVSGVKELTPEEWAYLYELWSGGTVRAREESLDSGDSGPWTYLYWDGDRGDVQQFEFESYTKATQFEAYCEELKTQQLGLT